MKLSKTLRTNYTKTNLIYFAVNVRITMNCIFILTARKLSCGKVMFSVICLFTSERRGSLHRKLPPSDIRPGDLPTSLTSGGNHWRHVQTCLLEDLNPPPPYTNILWWPPKQVRLARGWYASHYNAVMSIIRFTNRVYRFYH